MAVIYIDAAAAGGGDGTTWAQAFNEAEFESDIEGAGHEDGDIYYVKAGTYTLDSAYDASANDGVSTAPVSIIGVKAATTNAPPVFSDWGSGDDRPTFVCGANSFAVGDYYKVYNCMFTSTTSNAPSLGSYGVLYNCKSTVTSASNRNIAVGNNYNKFINCEMTGSGGGTHTGISSSTSTVAINCYIHDIATGITGGVATTALFNFLDTLTTGLNIAANSGWIVMNNTLYNCTTAVSGSTGANGVFVNNILETATDGFKWTTQEDINFFAFNHGNDTRCTDIWDGVAVTMPHGELGGGAAGAASAYSGGDPKITNAATGKCDLASDSPCIDAGMSLTLGVTAASEMNQGAWEATTAAASGSSPRFGDMTGGLK